MKRARSIEEIPCDKNSVVTVGTFDGVHLAHQKIIHEVVYHARKRNGRSVVVTFDPHPREVVSTSNSDVRLLTMLHERQEICEHLGVDWFLVLTFDKVFSQLSFRDFYVKYLVGGIGVSIVIEGYDHHWGRNREGNIEALIKLGKEFEFDVVNVEPFFYHGAPVNSSMIRNKLNDGLVVDASEILGRPYSLQGKVVPGDRRGRLLGYPTANLELDSVKKLVPKDGIYFVQIQSGDKPYFGMASIGVRPTFKTDGTRIIEVNIFDFDQDIYGCSLRVEFLRRLRDELKFDSADQLVQQMDRDKEVSRILQYDYQSIKQ